MWIMELHLESIFSTNYGFLVFISSFSLFLIKIIQNLIWKLIMISVLFAFNKAIARYRLYFKYFCMGKQQFWAVIALFYWSITLKLGRYFLLCAKSALSQSSQTFKIMVTRQVLDLKRDTLWTVVSSSIIISLQYTLFRQCLTNLHQSSNMYLAPFMDIYSWK